MVKLWSSYTIPHSIRKIHHAFKPAENSGGEYLRARDNRPLALSLSSDALSPPLPRRQDLGYKDLEYGFDAPCTTPPISLIAPLLPNPESISNSGEHAGIASNQHLNDWQPVMARNEVLPISNPSPSRRTMRPRDMMWSLGMPALVMAALVVMVFILTGEQGEHSIRAGEPHTPPRPRYLGSAFAQARTIPQMDHIPDMDEEDSTEDPLVGSYAAPTVSAAHAEDKEHLDGEDASDETGEFSLFKRIAQMIRPGDKRQKKIDELIKKDAMKPDDKWWNRSKATLDAAKAGNWTNECVRNANLEQMRNAYTKARPVNVCPYNSQVGSAKTPLDPNMQRYNAACLTITDVPTPDPFVTFAGGSYHMTFTSGDRVEIWSSPNLLEIGRTTAKKVIWRTDGKDSDHSGGVWAPELHQVRGRWYVYVAAEDRRVGNPSHRMFVIGGPPANQHPQSGNWEFLGRLKGMPQDQWAIDGTILDVEQTGKSYFVYSGWPYNNPSKSDKTQEIFIAEMADATSIRGTPVSISQPTEPWERSGASGINEGPQVLKHPMQGAWTGIVYSCAGSWTKDYKMNTLHLNNINDPLKQKSWDKGRAPLFQNRMSGGGPYGPGHGSFMNVSGDTVGIFHATDRPTDGWENRKARIQRLAWTDSGPWMNEVGPLVDGVERYLAPSGPNVAPGIFGSNLEVTQGSGSVRIGTKDKMKRWLDQWL